MISLFRTMSDDLHELSFKERPRLEQDRILQGLYDKGYSVNDMSKKLNWPKQSLYLRIDAHRGRGPTVKG